MEKMVIAFVLIALAAVVMFVKWSASAFGYVYCVVVGLMMAGGVPVSLYQHHLRGHALYDPGWRHRCGSETPLCDQH